MRLRVIAARRLIDPHSNGFKQRHAQPQVLTGAMIIISIAVVFAAAQHLADSRRHGGAEAAVACAGTGTAGSLPAQLRRARAVEPRRTLRAQHRGRKASGWTRPARGGID